ncbi:hypothetical protein JTE90_021468 [Oedothorax gibbosus]|uniref:Ig-like domain-containing protein n=1 Tax=Oedothorax gibbosus TaxID=931172 RepID=A0AAV6VY19_9ARAC|nr:hypothetical protein JTE90_021468 [Oedothorax gibbosus]
MKTSSVGYLFLVLYILGTIFGHESARFRMGRRRKALASAQQHFNVNGWGSASTRSPEPEFVGDISGVHVTAGKDATLRCVVDNLGDHKISWSVVNSKDQLSIGTNVFKGKDRISVINTNNSWTLQIKNVTQNDTGFYVCQISTNPIKSQAGFLRVVEPPEFVTEMTNRNVTVMENQNVTLSCRATGNPVPQIKWKREDGQGFYLGPDKKVTEYIGEELKIIGVSRDHMAAYLCLASNGVPPAISRRIYLDVKFPPLIYIQNQLVGAPEGIDVYLDCHTVAHPTSSNHWERDDEPVVSKNSRYHPQVVRNSFKTHMKLTIRNLQQEDYGTYQCVARNDISETRGSIKLYKPRRPVTTPEPVYPTRKVITASFTTEYQTAVTDVIRWDNTNTPGKQQKYGHDRVSSDEGENSSARTNTVFTFAFMLSVSFMLFEYLDSCRR